MHSLYGGSCNDTTMPEKFLTDAEVAEILRIDIKTVQRMCRDGRMKGIKAGREWRIPESALEPGCGCND